LLVFGVASADSQATFADPPISSEFGIDQPVLGPAPGVQTLPSVAFDGTNYLVVWQDNREPDADISTVWGARVDTRQIGP
jgi:hypothetical protein